MNDYSKLSRKEMLQIMSDAYKEAFGTRPRGIDYDSMTTQELIEELESYDSVMQLEEI